MLTRRGHRALGASSLVCNNSRLISRTRRRDLVVQMTTTTIAEAREAMGEATRVVATEAMAGIKVATEAGMVVITINLLLTPMTRTIQRLTSCLTTKAGSQGWVAARSSCLQPRVVEEAVEEAKVAASIPAARSSSTWSMVTTTTKEARMETSRRLSMSWRSCKTSATRTWTLAWWSS